jgi:hypothetical protein
VPLGPVVSGAFERFFCAFEEFREDGVGVGGEGKGREKRKEEEGGGKKGGKKENCSSSLLSLLSLSLSPSLTGLSEDEVVGPEDRAKGARADRVHGAGLYRCLFCKGFFVFRC